MVQSQCPKLRNVADSASKQRKWPWRRTTAETSLWPRSRREQTQSERLREEQRSGPTERRDIAEIANETETETETETGNERESGNVAVGQLGAEQNDFPRHQSL